MLEDASYLLTAFGDVESASVPEAIEALGNQIIASGRDFDEFLTIKDPHGAMEWLNQETEIAKNVAEFMRVHGHRCVGEVSTRPK